MSLMSTALASSQAPVAALSFLPDSTYDSQLFVRSASLTPALSSRSLR